MRPLEPVEKSRRLPRGRSAKTISEDDRQIVFTTPSGRTSRIAVCVMLSAFDRDDDVGETEAGEESFAVALTSIACAAVLSPARVIVTVASLRDDASGTRIGTEDGERPGRELTTAAENVRAGATVTAWTSR